MRKLIFTLLIIACAFGDVYSKQTIDINAPGTKRSALSGKGAVGSKLIQQDVEKIRSFNYNSALKNISSENIGDTLLLNLFDDQAYKAVIKNAYVVYNGVLGISAEIVGQPYSYCYISVSDDGISLTTDVLKDGKKFFINGRGSGAVVLQKSAANLHKHQGCEVLAMPEKETASSSKNQLRFAAGYADDLIPQYPEDYNCVGNLPDLSELDVEEEVTINVMFVYTEAARYYIEEWQGTLGKNIVNDVIIPNIVAANQAMENSGSKIRFNLVHTYKTETVESGRNAQTTDLYSLMEPGDGEYDEVFDLKIEHGADLVVILPKYDSGGGLAPSLTSEYPKGNVEWSFSSVNVTAADDPTSYAVVHEMAHNLGCGHDKEQASYPGPSMYSYSAGWHGIVPGDGSPAFGGRRCTIMAYPQSGMFEPSGYLRIPYFSSPNLNYYGTILGDAENSDNVRTMKDTKHYAAQYRNHKIYLQFVKDRRVPSKEYGDPEPAPEKVCTILYGKLKDGDKLVVDRDPGESPGSYSIWGGIFRGDVDVTCEYFPIIEEGVMRIGKKNYALNDTIVDRTGSPMSVLDLFKISSDIQPTVTYTGTEGTDYPATSIAPVEEGVYTVTVLFETNTNYAAIDATIRMEIKGGVVGIEDDKISKEVLVTPNVVNAGEDITVQTSLNEAVLKNATIQVYSMSGTMVDKVALSQKETVLKAPSVSGTYLIKVVTSGKQTYESKVIVR